MVGHTAELSNVLHALDCKVASIGTLGIDSNPFNFRISSSNTKDKNPEVDFTVRREATVDRDTQMSRQTLTSNEGTKRLGQD